MGYAELHCHSNYSFQEGASSVEELLGRAKELDYPALALTDHDNLCGAMHFAQAARGFGIQPITGAEITLTDGSHLTLLSADRQGYRNLSNLITYSYLHDRQHPALDARNLAEHTQGLILLTGCPRGRLPTLTAGGRWQEAESLLSNYLEWFGTSNVFVELQQRIVFGDIRRNRRLVELAGRLGVGVVATNSVHYHLPDRRRLQDALVAIRHHKSLEETHRERRVNGQFYLKSGEEMAALFKSCPQSLDNTLKIAARCSFDITLDLGYQFPDYPVPEGYTQQSYLEELCYDAARRSYGPIDEKVRARLDQEFALIQRHHLAGFFLIYHEIIQLAREIMIELGLSDPEIPLEERPPGRGRGSSVAMVVGYLIGLSHIDPLQYDLSLERFISEDLGSVPDIDLDFPRNIREELIKRVHQKWGWDCAALTGTIATYRMKGAVRDLGKALGLPGQDLDRLARRVESYSAWDLAAEMERLPEFQSRVDAPVWSDLIDLAGQLDGFPKYLGQHPGGMIISSSPLTDLVPVQPAAMAGRYICQWDKDAIDAAGCVKIDFLSLGTLSQLQDILQMIEERTNNYIDLSRIDHQDPNVYEMLHQGDTLGVFQVESPAQRFHTITRLRPENLNDMAFEVAAVRPGVGANDGVSQFIARRTHPEIRWEYDHPLEEPALGRTLGIVLYQDQLNQLAIHVAGFSPGEADRLRRAFSKKNNLPLIARYWQKFKQGALERGVPAEAAERIFRKYNGHYMFPESHAFAFGITAYHMAYLKRYYPLESLVALFNQQPMGFYSLETLKEDARRHWIQVLNPDINLSVEKCTIHHESLLLGLTQVRSIGAEAARAIVEARSRGGPFQSLADAMQRTGLKRRAIEDLVYAGAFDSLISHRAAALWEVGLRYSPASRQLPLPLPVEQDLPPLPTPTTWQTMSQEYYALGLYPRGYIMAELRPHLHRSVLTTEQVMDLRDGTVVTIAGSIISRQRPLGRAVFITLEDEYGEIPLMAFPKVYEELRTVLQEPLVMVQGVVARRDGTMTIIILQARRIKGVPNLPKAKNWN